MNPGDRIGNFRVVGSLGAGGMGEVCVAVDEKLDRRVALKAIREDHRMHRAAKVRFLREARVLSSLDHANICRIYDLLEGPDHDVLVLELIEGRSLSDAIKQGLDPAAKLKISMQIADVLVAAHAAGVVHRDLKPENVMLTDKGDVKVLDFGIARAARSGDTERRAEVMMADAPDPEPPPPVAKPDDRSPTSPLPAGAAPTAATALWGPSAEPALPDWNPTGLLHTAKGVVMGTPIYMSPEQARGEEVTASSDMFSFGLLMETLFTGHSPYDGDADVTAVLEHARSGNMDPVKGVRRDLARLIDQLRSAAPSTRPTAVQTARRLRWIRDRPRRRAWRFAIAAIVILSVGAGLKYTLDLSYERGLALTARDNADIRRGQAEQLFGYMLGDLRAGLKPLGRLDLLDGVGDEAMRYFASIPEEELSDDDLIRHAKALRQIGEVRNDQGSLPRAMKAFQEARGVASDLVRRDPEREKWLFELGQIHWWIGSVYNDQLKVDDALTEFRTYERISRQLTELRPSNLDWQLELAMAQGTLAAVYQSRGDIDLALASFEESIETKRRLCAARPGDVKYRRSLATGLAWLGAMTIPRGDLAGALDKCEEGLRLFEHLREAAPADTELLLEVSSCHSFVGEVLSMTGKTSEAEGHFREMQAIEAKLVARDETNHIWQRDLAVAGRLLGETLIAQGSAEAALTELWSSRTLIDKLVSADPTNVDFQLVRSAVNTALGAALLLDGRVDEALAYAELALDALEPIVESDAELSKARVHQPAPFLRGRLADHLGRRENAATDWESASALIATSGSDTRDPFNLEAWARSLLHLDRTDEAAPIIEKLHRMGYRGHALEALCEVKGLRLIVGSGLERHAPAAGHPDATSLTASRTATVP